MGEKLPRKNYIPSAFFHGLAAARLLYLPCEIGFVQICFEGYVIRSVGVLQFHTNGFQTVELADGGMPSRISHPFW